MVFHISLSRKIVSSQEVSYLNFVCIFVFMRASRRAYPTHLDAITLKVFSEGHKLCGFTAKQITVRKGLARNAARMGDMRNSYNILVVKPEGKKNRGRRRRR